MASSSIMFVRKRLTFADIQFADIQEKLSASINPRDTILSLIHIIDPLGAQKNVAINTALVELSNELPASEEKKIVLAKILLLFNELLKNAYDDLPTKEQVQEWEQRRQLLITDIYVNGNDDDKEFLRTHCDYEHSYYQMLGEVVTTGGEWVGAALTMLMNTPTELSEIYNAWRMSRSLQADALGKATFKVLNWLAAADPEQKLTRFQGSGIEVISDELVNEESEKGKEKEPLNLPASVANHPLSMSSFFEFPVNTSLSASQFTMVESDVPATVGSELNKSLTSSFISLNKPVLAVNLQAVKEKITALATHPGAAQLGTFNQENLVIMAQNCRRIDDAKANDYYTAEEVQKLILANKLVDEGAVDKRTAQSMMAGVQVRIRHQRYTEIIADLNDNVFTKLKFKNINDEEVRRQIVLIEKQWRLRTKFVSLPSTAMLSVVTNLEQIRIYIDLAKQEIEHDHTLNQEDWLAAINCLQELDQLANQTEADIVDAMLERLKLVPKEDLAAIESCKDENKSYFDDLVYHTLNSLVPCGLSEQFVIEFAQQTKPTTSLTVNIIKQFRDHILRVGTVEQKAQLENLISPDRENHSISMEENEDGFVIITKSPDEEERKTIVPKSLPVERTEVGELLSSSKLAESIELFDEYIFTTKQEALVLERAQQYFSQTSHQQFFAEKVKSYLLQHDRAIAEEKDCLKFAYEKTAEHLIETYATMFDRPSLQQAKEKFVEVAKENAIRFYGEGVFNRKFEAVVLDRSYDAVFAIENRTNEVVKELCALGATQTNLQLYRKTFNEAAYQHLLKQTPMDVEEANLMGKQAVYILRYVNQVRQDKRVPQDKWAIYKTIAERCISSSPDPTNEDNWEASLKTAQDVINLINVLEQESERIATKTWKSRFMDSALTEQKQAALTGKINSLLEVQSTDDYTALSESLLNKQANGSLLAKRGFFSVLPCVSSTTEINLRKYIKGEAPERKLIKIN